MTLSTLNVTNGIAALSVSGVTIKGLSGIPEQVQGRDCPLFFPHPEEFIQGGAGGDEGLETFGVPTGRFWLFNRTFRYVYLHAPVGTTRGIYEQYPAMTAKVDLLMEAIAEMDVTDVDVRNITVSQIGQLQDPAGSKFYGCTLDITVREKVNQ
jgi:hypothetical protein